MALQRLFGIKNDGAGGATGGSNYDLISANTPVIPDADIFWPVQSVSFDRGVGYITRDDEVRARRQRTKPQPFRTFPKMTVKGRAYRSVVEKLLKITLGGADTVTGAASPYTHTLATLGFGATYLQSVYAQMVVDSKNVKMSGAVVKSLKLDFPLDAEGTFELVLWGLFYDYFVSAAPSATYSGVSDDPLMLRDGEIFLDSSGTAIPDLQSYSITIDNMPTEPKHYAKQNIVTKSGIGTPAQTKKLWFPHEYRIRADIDVNSEFKLGNPNTAQDVAADFAQAQQVVFDVVGAPIAAGNDLLRITEYGHVHTDSNTDDLTKDADVSSTFSGAAFYSEADTAATKFEVVNASATVIT